MTWTWGLSHCQSSLSRPKILQVLRWKLWKGSCSSRREPFWTPGVLGNGDVSTLAAKEHPAPPPEEASPHLPTEVEPSEEPKLDVVLEATVEAEALPDKIISEDLDSSLVTAPSPLEQHPLGGGKEETEAEDPSAAPCCVPDDPTSDGLTQAHNVTEATCATTAVEAPPGSVQPESTDPESKPIVEAPKAPKIEEPLEHMTRNQAQMLASQSKQSTAPAEKDPVPAPTSRAKGRASEEEDAQAQHPRKHCFQRSSQQLQQQLNTSTQQTREVIQQTLATIIDPIKLDAIEPYHSDRSNSYFEYLQIRKKIEEKPKILCCITPQAPQCCVEYVTYTGSYLLDGKPRSKLHIPVEDADPDTEDPNRYPPDREVPDTEQTSPLDHEHSVASLQDFLCLPSSRRSSSYSKLMTHLCSVAGGFDRHGPHHLAPAGFPHLE